MVRWRRKFVLAGHTIQLAYYYSLQIDCTPNPIPEIVVVKRPALGRVRIDKASLYPTYGAGNVRSACNTKRTPTRQISYTASPDHKGDDEVAIEIYWHSGRKDGVTSSFTFSDNDESPKKSAGRIRGYPVAAQPERFGIRRKRQSSRR